VPASCNLCQFTILGTEYAVTSGMIRKPQHGGETMRDDTAIIKCAHGWLVVVAPPRLRTRWKMIDVAPKTYKRAKALAEQRGAYCGQITLESAF